MLIFLLVGEATQHKKVQQTGATHECINGQQRGPLLVQVINLIDQTIILVFMYFLQTIFFFSLAVLYLVRTYIDADGDVFDVISNSSNSISQQQTITPL